MIDKPKNNSYVIPHYQIRGASLKNRGNEEPTNDKVESKFVGITMQK